MAGVLKFLPQLDATSLQLISSIVGVDPKVEHGVAKVFVLIGLFCNPLQGFDKLPLNVKVCSCGPFNKLTYCGKLFFADVVKGLQPVNFRKSCSKIDGGVGSRCSCIGGGLRDRQRIPCRC